MDSFEFKQSVKIVSDPPGAKVFYGPEYLGTAPSYIRVPREKHPLVTYVFPDGEKREVQLKTSYRWWGSFAQNLWLVPLAPAGWAWDLYRGTAWSIREPDIIGQKGSHEWPKILPPKVVAIAPPVIRQYDRIKTLGVTIAHRLQSSETFQVLDYEVTEPKFRNNRSFQGLSGRESERERLFSILRADHILETKGELRSDGSYQVHGELRDIVTGRLDRVYDWELSPPQEPVEGSAFMRFAKKSFHLIPNTVSLSAVTYVPHLEIDHIDNQGKESVGDSFFERAASFVSTIGLSRIDRENFDVKGHWVFDFVPTLILSNKRVHFPNSAPLTDAKFNRWVASAGYGLETGYIGRYGFLYIDLIPALTWTHVSYDGPLGRGSTSGTKIKLNTEIGYASFISDHLVMRLFGRVVSEDEETWSKAIRGASGIDTPTDSASSGFAGISLGYYFDSFVKHADWKVR